MLLRSHAALFAVDMHTSVHGRAACTDSLCLSACLCGCAFVRVCLSAEPDVHSVELQEGDEFVLVATDGLSRT